MEIKRQVGVVRLHIDLSGLRRRSERDFRELPQGCNIIQWARSRYFEVAGSWPIAMAIGVRLI